MSAAQPRHPLSILGRGLFVMAVAIFMMYGPGVDPRRAWLAMAGLAALWIGVRMLIARVRREPLASLLPGATLGRVHLGALALFFGALGAQAFRPEWTFLKWSIPAYFVFVVLSTGFAVILRQQRQVGQARR